jgi:hypothetical protein
MQYSLQEFSINTICNLKRLMGSLFLFRYLHQLLKRVDLISQVARPEIIGKLEIFMFRIK